MKFFNNRQQPRYDNFQTGTEKPQPLTSRISLPEDSKAKTFQEWSNGGWLTQERKPMLEQLKAISERFK